MTRNMTLTAHEVAGRVVAAVVNGDRCASAWIGEGAGDQPTASFDAFGTSPRAAAVVMLAGIESCERHEAKGASADGSDAAVSSALKLRDSRCAGLAIALGNAGSIAEVRAEARALVAVHGRWIENVAAAILAGKRLDVAAIRKLKPAASAA